MTTNVLCIACSYALRLLFRGLLTYTIKAFRSNALDYLVKPIQASELREAIHKISSSKSEGDISLALQNLQMQTVDDQKLVLHTQTGTLRFALKQIAHIEGERNYSYARELSSKTLAYFEDILLDKHLSDAIVRTL